jgi:hypothetical protein
VRKDSSCERFPATLALLAIRLIKHSLVRQVNISWPADRTRALKNAGGADARK